MKYTIARAAFALLVLLLIAPAVSVGALALSGTDPLLYANLNRADFEFSYRPQANSDYALYLFSGDGNPVSGSAEIMENGEVIARGEGSGELLNVWLAAGTDYTVRVHGSGSAVIEMARSALSRSFSQPLAAEENVTSEKMIAHAYDAHWYSFRASESGRMLLTCVPLDPHLELQALVFDASGTLAGTFETLPGGACRLFFKTEANESYFVRVNAPNGSEGYYALNLHRPQDDSAGAIAFDAAEYVISAGGEIRLGDEAGSGALLWISDSPDVAAVQQDGTVRGMKPGEAMITACGMNGDASVRIRVEHVPLEGIRILGDGLELSAGDEIDVQLEFTPENASVRGVRFLVQDPEIASISRSGVLKALQPGKTVITASAADGTVSDTVEITVTPAMRRYRALLVGEENYPFAEVTRRNGSENSVQAIRSLLGTVEFESAAYSVRTANDLSRAELLAQIRDCFKSATAQDLSLLYITCHGSYTGGMSFLELSDGSTLSVRDLERELRGISGSVVVMIDCCASGGAIGAHSERIAFARGVQAAFSAGNLRSSKYKVIVSAGLDQDSYRIAFNADAGSGVMATVFARALCDAAGWDIDRDARGTMGADADYNGAITLGELQLYLESRVNWYLDIASGLTGEDYRQTVYVYPEGDPLVLFERKS